MRSGNHETSLRLYSNLHRLNASRHSSSAQVRNPESETALASPVDSILPATSLVSRIWTAHTKSRRVCSRQRRTDSTALLPVSRLCGDPKRYARSNIMPSCAHLIVTSAVTSCRRSASVSSASEKSTRVSLFPRRLSLNVMSRKSVKHTLRLKGFSSWQNCSTSAMLIPTPCFLAFGFFGVESTSGRRARRRRRQLHRK